MPNKAPGTKRSHNRYTLHLVSDSTGGLAQHTMAAILTQFPDLELKLEFHRFCSTEKKIRETIPLFKKRNSLVLHAVVDPKCKMLVAQGCDQLGIPHYDLTGPLVQFIAGHTHTQPQNDVCQLHRTDEGYFHRVDALEFTLQHDDSRRLDTAHEADIILIGLSRVSKTPTSIFLGALGHKTANVSIVEGRFPKELDRCKKRTVALTMTPKHLHEIRARRFEINRFSEHFDELGGDDFGYLDLREIIHEVSAAEAEYRRRGYPIIDITGLTVEETAAHVLSTLKISGRQIKGQWHADFG